MCGYSNLNPLFSIPILLVSLAVIVASVVFIIRATEHRKGRSDDDRS